MSGFKIYRVEEYVPKAWKAYLGATSFHFYYCCRVLGLSVTVIVVITSITVAVIIMIVIIRPPAGRCWPWYPGHRPGRWCLPQVAHHNVSVSDTLQQESTLPLKLQNKSAMLEPRVKRPRERNYVLGGLWGGHLKNEL